MDHTVWSQAAHPSHLQTISAGTVKCSDALWLTRDHCKARFGCLLVEAWVDERSRLRFGDVCDAFKSEETGRFVVGGFAAEAYVRKFFTGPKPFTGGKNDRISRTGGAQ